MSDCGDDKCSDDNGYVVKCETSLECFDKSVLLWRNTGIPGNYGIYVPILVL